MLPLYFLPSAIISDGARPPVGAATEAAQLPSQADNPPIRWLGGGAAVGGSELLGGTPAAHRSLRITRQSRRPPCRSEAGT